jgi:transcriptional regulator with XRE-family HTH domain
VIDVAGFATPKKEWEMARTTKDAKRPSEVFGAQMGTVRGRRGLSLQDLADRLTRLGFPMDRTTLNKLENGRRGLSLDEALAIAAALDVSPLHLFVPIMDSEQLEIAPKVTAGAVRARKWLRGEQPLPIQDAFAFGEHLPAGEKAALRNTSLTMVRQYLNNEMYRPRPDQKRLIETLEASSRVLREQEKLRGIRKLRPSARRPRKER